MAHLSCPSCRFTLQMRNALRVDYCPRCLARRHQAVPLDYVPTPREEAPRELALARRRWPRDPSAPLRPGVSRQTVEGIAAQ